MLPAFVSSSPMFVHISLVQGASLHLKIIQVLMLVEKCLRSTAVTHNTSAMY